MISHLPRWRAFLALSLFLAAPACAKKEDTSAERGTATAEPIQVAAAAVREAPMPVSLTLTGELRPDREANLAAGTAGRVIKMNVDRGSVVKANDVLAELDTSAAAISLAEAAKAAQSAKVHRDATKLQCERARTLFESGAISKGELDARNAECQSSEIGVEAAGLRAALGSVALRDAVLRAPFAGIIEMRSTDVGEYLMPGSRVAVLVAIDKLRLDILVPEAQLSRVQQDAVVGFRVAAYPDRRFTAKVRLVGAMVREGTRDVLVEALVDNADRALKPGMFTMVDIVTSEAPAPVVPRSALVKRGDASHVFVIVDGRAHERVVKLGPERGDDVAVLRGVSPGERVVTTPPDSLTNGAPVGEGG